MAEEFEDELRALRADLSELDARILGLVAERTVRVAEIGKLKSERGDPIRDYRRERQVVEHARATAARLNLSPELAEAITLLLIRSALEVQEKQGMRKIRSGSGKTALVIGGTGKMGRWFVRFLSSLGFAIEIADPAAAGEDYPLVSEWRQSKLAHDLIVVATPLAVTNTILAEMSENPPRGLIFDIGSLKSPLRGGLTKLAESGARVTSIHPMFGPDTSLLSGRHVIFVDVGCSEATEEAQGLFEPTMAVRVTMDLESHDRLISYILGLSHAVNIAFFTALAESGEAAPSLSKLSSTTFDEQLGVASKVSRESPQLYFEIQALNDYGTESLSALLYAVERLRSVIRAGDEKGFEALMERGRAYLGSRQEE